MTLDPDRLEEIFEQALNQPDPSARADYLTRTCTHNLELRRQIEQLLGAHHAAGGFLDLPHVHGSLQNSTQINEGPGSQIGQYQLLEQIGEGGFAIVFMAEQEFPVRRRVALKIIKPGMDTRQVVVRFEAERQALAMMDHPSIAKVFDAGTTSTGRPFFVMELVKGTPITEYCDRHRLTIPQRLELFSQVCRAVQHAHQKGLIHRDLKPSNVLVNMQDDQPAAKVIDFGIAKATESRLTERTLFTEVRQLIGTPTYMSPEQMDGSFDIDTRTDVYSLGVLLYELLAGTPPFDPKELRSRTLAEMQRILREVEPQAPSTRLRTLNDTLASIASQRRIDPRKLSGVVRGELDWIVLRCLEKDRRRRYEATSALAQDIQHYLADQPVQARPASRRYKLKKFIRRNRLPVAAAAALAGALMLGAIGTTWQSVRATRAERQAQDNFKRAREAVSDILSITDNDMYNAPGSRPMRVKLMKTVIEHYRPILDQPSDDPAPRAELARLYDKLAFAAVWTGEDMETVVVPAFDMAQAIQERLLRERPGDRGLRKDLGRTLFFKGWLHPQRDKRRQSIDAAIETFQGLVAEDSADVIARIDLADSIFYSRLLTDNASERESLELRVIEMREQLLRELPRSVEVRRDLGESLQARATVLAERDPAAALAALLRSVDLFESLVADLEHRDPAILVPARPTPVLAKPSIAFIKRTLAQVCLAASVLENRQGRPAQAIELSGRAREIYRELVDRDPSIETFVNELADAMEHDPAPAQSREHALTVWTRLAAAHPDSAPIARQLRRARGSITSASATAP